MIDFKEGDLVRVEWQTFHGGVQHLRQTGRMPQGDLALVTRVLRNHVWNNDPTLVMIVFPEPGWLGKPLNFDPRRLELVSEAR